MLWTWLEQLLDYVDDAVDPAAKRAKLALLNRLGGIDPKMQQIMGHAR